MNRTFGYKRKFESPILEVLTKLYDCVSSYTYEEFFSRYDFLNLIQDYFNEKIPNITWVKQNELTKLISDTNNIFCFEFLKKKQPEIFFDKPYETKDDKIKIIELFFKKVIYNFDIKKMTNDCDQIIPFLNSNNPAQIFYSYKYFIALINKLFNFCISEGPIERCYNNIKIYHKFPFILDAVHGDLFTKTNKIFYLIQIDIILNAASFYDDKNQEKFQKKQEMDPICVFLNYKNFIKLNCESIDQIFDDGYFPSLVELILNTKNIPGIIDPINEFDIIKNNLLTLKFLSSNTKNLIQEGQHFRTTQERFDLLKSIISNLYKVNPNKTLKNYNKYMPDEFHINDINELFTVNCFFRYFLCSLNYENICYYDDLSLTEFDKCIKTEIKKNTDTSNENFDPKYSGLPIFIRSCFYKSDKYRFLILHQFDSITHFIEHIETYEYHYENPYHGDDDDNNNDDSINETQIRRMEHLEILDEKQMKKNQKRKNNEKSVFYPDANFLDFYNYHLSDQYNLYHSYNPYFHFNFERAHPISTFYPSDDEAVSQYIENKIQDGFIKPHQKNDVEDDNDKLKSNDFDYSYDNDDIIGDDEDDDDDMTKSLLLNTINALYKGSNVHFKDFNQTVKNNSIPKFVMHILKLDKIKNVSLGDQKHHHHHHHKSKKLRKSELKNIKAVINYLQTKEPKFLTLVFDFETEELIEPSAILFYSKFLNLFFLKKTKEELFKRCIEILKIKNCNKYNVLTDYHTYEKLIKKSFSKDQSTEKVEIPFLFDKQFLQICKSKHKLHDVLYYQLQLIFDAIDEKKKNKEPSESTTDKQQQINLNNNNSNVTDKYAKDKLKYPLTFRERLKLYKLSVKNKDSNGNFETHDFDVEPAEKYWNSIGSKSSFDDGILVTSEEIANSQVEWTIAKKEDENKTTEDKDKAKTKTKKKEEKSKKKKKTEPEEKITNKQIKPFKLFIYNEKKSKWCFNKDDFAAFCENSLLNSNDIPTPLILYMDSFEKDLITINSNFINRPYPDLNDKKDQIYVYALCDRSLQFLSDQIDTKDIENSKIKPIFLLLHVPEKKKNHPEIKKIVVQIYSFLSYICDIEIVVMNKLYYKKQIYFTSMINKIFQKKDDIFVRKSSILNNDSKEEESESDDDDSYSNDVDDFEEEEEDDDDIESKDNFNDFKIISKIPIKQSKIIILANDPNVHNNAEEYNPYTFNTLLYSYKCEMKDLLNFSLININEPVTYKPFLDNLKDFVLKSDTFFGEILNRFKLIQMSELTNSYIQIKTQKSWKEKLENLIMNRKSMYKIDESCNPFVIILRIKNELSKILSHYDLEFYQECSSLISEIEKEFDKNRDIIKDELNRSSSKYISDLEKVKDYELFDKKTIENLIESHINFLKKEYFDIVKSISQSDNFVSYYETNVEILNKFIEDGFDIINNLRKNTKINFRKVLPPEDEDDCITGSTNYEIRQKENIKEIKIQFSYNGDLTDEIPQDF